MALFKTETPIDAETPLSEVPAVREAQAAARETHAALESAKAEAAKFPAGQLTLEAVTAAGKLESAARAHREAQKRLEDVRGTERARLVAARATREKELRRALLAALEKAAGAAGALHEHKQRTEQLCGGRRPWDGFEEDWAGLLLSEAGRECMLDVWRRSIRADSLI